MANIKKYYWYSLLIWATFWQPVIVIFWLENGLSMTQVFTIRSIHSIGIIFLEVPTGAIADYLGKKRTLFFATVLYSCSLGFYFFGTTFWVFVIAELIAAVGTSLVSGADSAFVYDSLEVENKTESYTAVMGKAGSIQLVSQGVSSIVGGFLGGFSTRLTFMISLIPTLGGLGIARTFEEPHILQKEDEKRQWSDILVSGFRFILQHRTAQWMVMFIALITAFDLCILWLYQPYMEFTGLPLIYFGVAAASFNFIAAIASRYADAIEKLLGNKILIAIPALMLITLLLMSNFLFSVSFLFIWGLQIIRGIRGPILFRDFLEKAAPGERATVISVVSLVTRLTFAILAPFVGWIVDNQSITSAINFIALLIILSFTIMGLWYILIVRNTKNSLLK